MAYKVLIVDDEDFIRRGLCVCMDWQGCGCELAGTAAGAEEALGLIRRSRPDIVITDIHMEHMSGLELLEQINLHFPEIKTILLTGIYDFHSVCGAIKFDVVDLVLKPTSPVRIRQALAKAIRQIESAHAADDMQEQLKQQSVQNLQLKQAMLVSGLADTPSGGAENAAALAAAGLTLHSFLIVTLLMDGAAAALREAEESIAGYIRLAFEDCGLCCLFTGPRSFHLLLDFEQPRTPAVVRSCCISLSKTIDTLTEFYSAIGISALHTDPAELHRAKAESVSAANDAVYDEGGLLVADYTQMPRLSAKTLDGLRQYIDRLSTAVESRREAEALALLEEIIGYFTAQKVPFEEARGIGVLIGDLCIRHLWDYGMGASGNIFSPSECRGFSQYIRMDDLTKELRRIVTLTVRRLSEAGGSALNVIDQTEDYIRKNYREDLSLEKLAARCHISPSYLSRLFKSQKGVSLMTYVQNTRIEQAKRLIASTELRTYEIAAAVGIPDPVYFSKTFKKVTGIRVRDYREQLKGSP